MRQILLICFLSILHSTCKVLRQQSYNERLDVNETSDPTQLHRLNVRSTGWNVLFDQFGCPQTTDYICNTHNPKYNCTCYRPNQINPMMYPSCDKMFDLKNIRAYVIELRTKLPKNRDSVENFDTFLGELIEDLCVIPQKYLIILRKRCVNNAMLVQIGFLRATDGPLSDRISIADMQAVHPNIFLENKQFMQQRYLPILNVSEVDFLTPVIRQPGESIIFNKRLTQDKSISLLSTLLDIGFIIFLGLVLLIANLIPICLLWRIIRDRRTRDSSPRTQVNHL